MYTQVTVKWPVLTMHPLSHGYIAIFDRYKWDIPLTYTYEDEKHLDATKIHWMYRTDIGKLLLEIFAIHI